MASKDLDSSRLEALDAQARSEEALHQMRVRVASVEADIEAEKRYSSETEVYNTLTERSANC